MPRWAPILLGAAILLGLFASERSAWAIPAFARRYETSCSTCHTQFPNLNQFGEAFRRNGYQFPAGGDADAIKQAPMTLVSEARRDLFPRSDWPTDLARYPPLALVLTGLVPIFPDPATRPADEKLISFDRMFSQAQLFLGARAGDNVAVFAGVGFAANASVQFERGFVAFSNLAPADLLNVRIGQFEPQVFSFSSYRRIGGPAYLILNAPLAPASFSLEPFVRGVNLSGTVAGRFGWDAAWVQGVEAPNYGGELVRQMPRDGYAHVFTRIGGMRLDGVEPDDAASGERTHGGRRYDPSLEMGVFTYAGEHDVETTGNPATTPGRDFVTKFGGDTLARLGDVSVLLALAAEHHAYQALPTRSRVQGLGEVTWQPFPWMAATVRTEADVGSSGSVRRLVPILSVHPRINMKFQAYAIIADAKTNETDYRISEIDLGATYAF